ncbi:type I-G CRISPR-associated protein Csb2 [Dactylosporangium maewongense]|uniref:type I-G CRISPR-associated protein Csb2 n=1 Tax=Dactylosporangium maewongense TaxID=634393 RepID=UPI0031D24269
MTTTLVVRFVLGRYHANPWGHHVNEGQVELPPSPWRVLRALYAVWKTRAPDLDDNTVHTLLGRLAEPPVYFVPPFQLGHTRHYLPNTKLRAGAASRDKTLDAFAVFDRNAELAIRWPFTLPAEQVKALGRLAESLPYLGRADSLCEARLDETWQPGQHHTVASPLDLDDGLQDTDTISLLTPTMPLDLAALTARPVDLRAGNLLFPPATQFLDYARPLEQQPRRTPRWRRTWQPVPAVRFTVAADVLPPIGDAVAITDRLRLAAVAKLNAVRGHEHSHSLLAGRGSDGRPLTDHQHAHYLALPNPERRLAELVIWTPGGLAEDELTALSRIVELRPPKGMPGAGPLDVRMAAYGDTVTVLGDLTGPARAWQSLTPFVPPRHPKHDWGQFVTGEIHRELAFRGLPAPTSVELAGGDWTQFLRQRPSKRFARTNPAGPIIRRGADVTLTFPEPLLGPFALGYLAHFGLGLFRPASRD